MKEERKNQLHARDQQYAEILKRRQEYEAELDVKAPSEGLGAAKGKGQYWQKRLGQAKRRAGKPKRELNTRPCHCGAQSGQACISKKTGRVRFMTHDTQAMKGARQTQRAGSNPSPTMTTVKPSQVRADGSPILQEGQVYVIRTGAVYHPYWCEVLGAKWDSSPKGLLVTALADVGSRLACKTCAVV